MIRRLLIALLTVIGYITSPGRWSGTAIAAFTATLALAMLGYDCYQLATSTVDMGRHWPFLVPTVLLVFGYLVWRLDHRPASAPGSIASDQ